MARIPSAFCGSPKRFELFDARSCLRTIALSMVTYAAGPDVQGALLVAMPAKTEDKCRTEQRNCYFEGDTVAEEDNGLEQYAVQLRLESYCLTSFCSAASKRYTPLRALALSRATSAMGIPRLR